MLIIHFLFFLFISLFFSFLFLLLRGFLFSLFLYFPFSFLLVSYLNFFLLHLFLSTTRYSIIFMDKHIIPKLETCNIFHFVFSFMPFSRCFMCILNGSRSNLEMFNGVLWFFL